MAIHSDEIPEELLEYVAGGGAFRNWLKGFFDGFYDSTIGLFNKRWKDEWMKTYKKLIAGIAFLVLQAIVFFVRGFPQIGSDAYSAGYLVGILAPGIIGIVLIIVHFITKKNK